MGFDLLRHAKFTEIVHPQHKSEKMSFNSAAAKYYGTIFVEQLGRL